jgi:hypothetical protein
VAAAATAQRAQQPPDADLRQPYAELATDKLTHHRAGPQRKRRPQLVGVVADDQPVQLGKLRASELGWPPRHRTGLEGFQPSLAILRQPRIHRCSGHPQCLGDVVGVGALLDLTDRTNTQLLEGLVVELAAVVVAQARTRPNPVQIVKLLMNGLVSG